LFKKANFFRHFFRRKYFKNHMYVTSVVTAKIFLKSYVTSALIVMFCHVCNAIKNEKLNNQITKFESSAQYWVTFGKFRSISCHTDHSLVKRICRLRNGMS
jgi:hypothetical protein